MVVGSAEIVVRAITKQVRNDIKRAFADTMPDVARAGREAGDAYTGEFSKVLDKNLGPALENSMSDAANKAATAAGREMSSTLGNELEAPAAQAGRRAGSALTRGLAGGSRGGGNPLKWLTDSLFAVPSAAKSASQSLTQLTGIGTLVTGAISGLVGMLSAAAGGLYIMVGAAMQAAGSLAVLPGIVSVAAQAFGALKMAFGGVGTALKAGAKAQTAATAATSGGGKAANAAAKSNEALARAQERLKIAQEAARRAQDALNKAQDRASTGAEEAALAQQLLAGAEQKRQQTLSDPNASATDGAAAQKAVDTAVTANKSIEREKLDAMNNLRKAEEDDANARRAVEDAEAARDRAQRAAKNKAAAAKSPAVKAAEAYKQALDALSPSAQEFVKKILEMKKTFKDIGKDVQQNFFVPINEGLDSVIDSDFFPHLKRELPKTGTILGNIGKKILTTFSNDKNMKRFGNILEGNNEILDVFNKKTDDGQTPTRALVDIIMKLAEAVQPLTKEFVTWIGTLITGINTSKAFTEKDGLVDYFERAGGVAKTLGSIFGNIFGGLRNIGIAGRESGNDLLTSFEEATGNFKEWSQGLIDDKSAEGYFGRVKVNLEKIGGLIVTITEEFVKLGDNPGIGELAESLEPAVKNIGEMLDNFNNNGGALGELATTVTSIMEAFADSNGIQLFLKTMNFILVPVEKLLGSKWGKWALGVTGAVFAISRAVSFTLGAFKFFFKGIVGGWVSTIEDVKKGVGKFKGLMAKLKGEVPAPRELTPAEKEAKEASEAVGRALADGLAVGVEESLTEVQRSIDTLLDAVLETFDASKPLWVNAGENAADGFAEGIRANLTDVANAATDLGDEALEALKAKLDIASPSKQFHNMGEFSGEGYVDGVRAEIDEARKAGADLASAAADGAASQEISANVTGATSSASDSVSDAASSAASSAGIDVGDILDSEKSNKKLGDTLEDTGKKSGKMKKGLSSLGGGIKALSGGLLGLVGGPIGAIMLLITGLTLLYKKSPEFKKFVDTIVKAVMPVVKAIGGWFLGVLNKLFKWVNENMPAIKDKMSSVLDSVKSAFSSAFGAIKVVWEKVLKPVFKAVWTVVKLYFGAIKIYIRAWLAVFRAVFKAVKSVWEDVLRPVFGKIKSVAKSVFGAVETYINGMKNVFVSAKEKMSTVKDAIVGIFDKIKAGARKPIKWVIDTVWNAGVVKMAGNIPGVGDTSGWVVNTSEWATGGWTGPGAKYDVAGLVHADEFVINKASRRIFENNHPGLLDHINRTGKMPGYALGGAVAGWGKKVWKKGSEKFKDAKSQVTNIIKWVGGIKGSIASNLNSDWGKKIQGIPKATANAFISALNNILPHALPKVPIGQPFPGVGFRAKGGPVTKGMPYVVGENQPELFIPDVSGKIIPSLQHPDAKHAIESILKVSGLLGGNVDMSRASSTNNVNSGSKSLTVNVNNPAPERSSQSVTRVLRNKSAAAGWSM